jgi:hypothetical protein
MTWRDTQTTEYLFVLCTNYMISLSKFWYGTNTKFRYVKLCMLPFI